MILKDLKARLVFLFTILTYLIAGLSSLICNRMISHWYGLIVGIFFMLIALIFHFIAKKKSPLLYIVSSCINAIATGLSIGAYYSQKEIFLSVFTVTILFLPYLLLCYIICLSLSKASEKGIARNLLGCFFLLAIILLIIFWKQSTLCSYGFFALLIALFYFLLCIRTFHTPRNILNDLSLTSFGFYLLIVIIVSAILSDGDSLDFLPDFEFSNKKGKQKIK